MKFFNHFSGSWRVALACVLSLSLLSSCMKYDDTDLINRMDDLEQRVENLEADLTSQVAALQQMIAGQVTVVSCNLSSDGSVYTIILSDGTTLSVSSDEVAGRPIYTEPTGVVGVIEQNGVYYWAIDGEPLIVDGQMVPVVTEVEEVIPAVRVNPATNEWEVSVDGGNTWYQTGYFVEEEQEQAPSIFSGVTEDDTYVYFTLANGTVITVEKASESDFSCTLLSGKQYFDYSETKSVRVELSNVAKTTVTKPDGWRVSVSGSSLQITAPAIDNNYAETSGKVVVFAASNDGELSIQELDVEVGTTPPVYLTVSSDGTVSFDFDEDLLNDWSFYGVFYGVMTASEFTPEAALATLDPYNAWPTTEAFTTTVADMVGSSYDPDETYVVWALPSASWGSVPETADGIMYEVYTSVTISISLVSATFEDAEITVETKGCSSYYAGLQDASWFEASWIVEDLNSGWASYYEYNSNYSGMISKYAAQWDDNYIQPNGSYIAFAVPIIPGKTEYSEADVFYLQIDIPGFTTGGTTTMTIGDVTSTTTSIEAQIVPGAGTYVYYATYITEEIYNSYADEASLVDYVLQVGTQSRYSDMPDGYTFSRGSLNPGAKGYILAVSVDANGQAGVLAVKEANTNELAFSDTAISATVTSTGLSDAVITLSGDVAQFMYDNRTNSSWMGYPYQGSLATAESSLALYIGASYVPYYIGLVEAQNGEYTVSLTGLNAGEEYHFVAIGITADGMPTRAVEVSYTPGIDATMFVRSDDAKWTEMQSEFPVISNITINGISIEELTEWPSGYKDVEFDVTAGESCAKIWACVVGSEEYVTGMTERSRAESVLSQYYTTEIEGNEGHVVTYAMGAAYLYLMWQDTDGYIYYYTMENMVNRVSAE